MKRTELTFETAFAMELMRDGALRSLVDQGLPREVAKRCFCLGYCAGIDHAFTRATEDIERALKRHE